MNKNRKKFIVCFIGVIFLILTIILVILIKQHKFTTSELSGGIISEGLLPGYTREQIEEILQLKADKSSFSFEVNSRPVFNDGKSEGNLRLANPPYNNYELEFEITLDKDNKSIFKSKRLSPNQYIENAKLQKNLEKGSYNATTIITAYDKETGTSKGTSYVKLIITVEN